MNVSGFQESMQPIFDGEGMHGHVDHRQRLRARLMAGSQTSIVDYEMLELVLFRAIPRRDVKPIAKALLAAFGSFSSVLAASPSALKRIKGVGEAVVLELKVVEAAAHRMGQSRIIGRSVVSSWNALLEYCTMTMAEQSSEQFRILFLDKKNSLIADELQGQGTVDHVPVYPREVVKRALELNASALILVHNHPSGDPSPSPEDIAMTRRIMQGGEPLGIVLHDHVIVARSGTLSFRSEGLI